MISLAARGGNGKIPTAKLMAWDEMSDKFGRKTKNAVADCFNLNQNSSLIAL